MSHNQTELLKKSLAERILILDGAMGTMIQKYKLTEADFRGERFKESAVDLRGNNDLLTLTQLLMHRQIFHNCFGLAEIVALVGKLGVWLVVEIAHHLITIGRCL